MSLFSIIKDRFSRKGTRVLRLGGQLGLTLGAPMQLSVVYACVGVLAKAMAMMPLEPYRRDRCGHSSVAPEHPLYRLLALAPNGVVSRYTLIELMVQSMLLRGNAYAYIERGRAGSPAAIHFLPPGDVTVAASAYIDEPPTYTVAGLRDPVPASDMIHVLNYTDDGVNGISTLQHAARSIELAGYANESSTNFYKSGGALAGVISSDVAVTAQQRREMQQEWARLGDKGGVAVLARGAKYAPISVPPLDAQLLESRKYSVEDICRFFHVSPQKVFDYTHSSYSTVEATELAFLNDTLLPLIVKFEQEFSRKLFTPAELARGYQCGFNTARLMRADKNGQANYYSKMFNCGVLSVNEIRRDLDLPHIDGGDSHFVQVNLMELQNAGRNMPADNRLQNDSSGTVSNKNQPSDDN